MIAVATEKCIGCGLCVEDCNTGKMQLIDKKAQAVEENPRCLICGHCVAVCPQNAVRFTEYEAGEPVEYNPATFDVPAENLLNFIKFRRSIRSYLDKPVEQEKIERILEAAAYSPTGGNRRLFRYVVINGAEKVQQTVDVSLKALDHYARTATPEQIATLPNPAYVDLWKMLYQQRQETGRDGLFFQAPLVFALVGKQTERLDAGIAASNMELLAYAQKLGACYIGFFGRAVEADPNLKASLGMQPDEMVLTTLAVGYTNRKYRRTVNRKAFQEVLWL